MNSRDFAFQVMILCLSGCFSLWPVRLHAASATVTRYTVQIVRTLPHSVSNFTQGLVYHQGVLYESTGLYGQSSLQRVDARTGQIQKVLPVAEVFAEGLARWQNRLIQLTWQERTAFVYNLSDFALIGTFHYDTEGWGLTTDGQYLIMSDGSDALFFRDSLSFEVKRTLPVTLEGKPLNRLNELEWVEGLIYANVWYETVIVQIDPASGKVVGVIDAAPLLRQIPRQSGDHVLNGIAYNPDAKTLYLTGKCWPVLFEVSLQRVF